MEENRTTKKVFNAQRTGTWRRGRSNLRWIDGLEKDHLVLKTKKWRTLAGRKLAWRRLLEKAKVVTNLYGTLSLILLGVFGDCKLAYISNQL
ncbi:hypothetical protein TNCV_3312361 [Trichonephila clavipes]|nr:hypothetical protein TNCV_3312361 [Trichonephila clavipes]